LSATVTARRPGESTWRPLLSFDEFSDVQPGGESVAARLDPGTLNFVRVRSLLEELLAALDSTFTARKLVVLVATSLAFLLAWVPAWLGVVPPLASALVAVGLLLVQLALLSRLTFLELSRLRPTRLREALAGTVPLTLRLLFSLGVVAGAAVAVRLVGTEGLAALEQEWLTPLLPWATQVGSLLLALLALYLAPLAAVLVMEECGLIAGLVAWRRLTRDRALAVLVAQWLALTIGMLLIAPLLLLAWLLPSLPLPLLLALAVPLVSGFLAIAHVFLMLHFRYSE
jgi:hypothetical protein